MTLQRVTSEQYHAYNLRLELLQKDNFELQDEVDFLRRQNGDFRQSNEKQALDLEHYKALYNQSQLAVTKNSLEIKQLKSLHSLPSSMDVNTPSPQQTAVISKLVTSEVQDLPQEFTDEKGSIFIPLPILKHRSASMSPAIPVQSTPKNYFSQIEPPREEDEIDMIIKHRVSESSRILSELYKQEVQASATLKRRDSLP